MMAQKCTAKLIVAITLLVSCIFSAHAASNAWSRVSSIPEAIDGMFYTGEAFVGYRLAPTLRIYSSTNGGSWDLDDTSISPFFVSHDNHGALLAMTATNVGDSNVAIDLWRNTVDSSWTNVGRMVSGNFEEPHSASAIANDSTLFIQMKLKRLGNGSTVPTLDLKYQFTTDRQNPGIFSGGFLFDAVGKTIVRDSHFVSTASNLFGYERIVTSTNGYDWDAIFSFDSTGRKLTAHQMSGSYDSLSFFQSTGGMSFAVPAIIFSLNGLGEIITYDLPSNFPVATSFDNFIYNGDVFVVTLNGNLFTSFSHAQTWETTQLTSIRGVGDDGSQCLLADTTSSSNTVFHQLTYSLPVTYNVGGAIKSRMEAYKYIDGSTLPPVTNWGNALFLDSANSSSNFFQLECSRDLKEWVTHSLPRMNEVMIKFDEFNSEPKMFFRLKTAE